MSPVLRLFVTVVIPIIAASAGFTAFVVHQTNHVTENNKLLLTKIHQLQGFADEAKKCGFVQRTLKLLPRVRTLLPEFPDVVAPQYPSAESTIPSWMPDFVREYNRLTEDYRTNQELFKVLKASLNEYKHSLEQSPFRFLWKNVPAEVDDIQFNYNGIHVIAAWSISLALFMSILGALFYKTLIQKASGGDEGNVSENTEGETIERIREIRSKVVQTEKVLHTKMQESKKEIEKKNKIIQQQRTILQDEKRGHETQLREKEEELRETTSKLDETDKDLHTKMQEFETEMKKKNKITQKGDVKQGNKENKVTIRLHTNELQGNTLVTLSGNPGDVKVVHEDIMKRLKAQKEYIARKELSKPLDEPMEVVPGLLRVAGNRFVFRIKDFQRKYLIGPSGKTVRILEEYFGVAIHARQDGTDAKSVVCEIVGLKDDVIWAFEEIEIVLRQRGLKFDEKGNLQNNSSENDLFRCSLQAVPAAKEIVQPKVATPRCSLQAVPAAKEIVQPKVATPAPLKVSIPSTSGSGQGRVLSFSQAVKGSRPRSPRFWEFLTPKPQRVRRLRRQRGTPSNVETSTTPKNTGAIPKVPKEPKGPAHLIKSSSPENNSS